MQSGLTPNSNRTAVEADIATILPVKIPSF